MTKNLSEEREALYQMICSLKSEDIQKVVSYVSFLRFVDVYKDKAMADLLKIELSKSDKADSHLPPPLELPYEPAGSLDVEPVIEPFIEDVPRYKKLKEELLQKADDVSMYHEAEADIFYAPAKSDYFDKHQSEVNEINDIRMHDMHDVEPFFDETREAPAETETEPETEKAEPVQTEDNIDGELYPQPPLYRESQQDSLKRLMKGLGLCFSDLAFLFQVSPSIVKMWFGNDVMMGAEEEMQLLYFLEVVNCIKEIDVDRLNLVIRRQMPDEEFFLEKVKDRKVTEDNLKMLQEMGGRSEETRRKFKGATKPFHSMQDAIELYATPLHCEG